MKENKDTNFFITAFIILQIITIVAFIILKVLKINTNILFGINMLLQITLFGVSDCLQRYNYSQKNNKKLSGIVTDFSKYRFGGKNYYLISVLTDDGRVFTIDTHNFRAVKYRYKKKIEIIFMPESVMPQVMLKEDLQGKGRLFLFLLFPIFYIFGIPLIAYLINGI
mgnify:CR=1 FL=1